MCLFWQVPGSVKHKLLTEALPFYTKQCIFSGAALPPLTSLAACSHPSVAIHSLSAVLPALPSVSCWNPEEWKQQPSPGTAHSGFTSEARKSWSALRNTLCSGWLPASVGNCKIREDHSGYAKLINFWWESKYSFKVWKKTIWISLYLTHDNVLAYI